MGLRPASRELWPVPITHPLAGAEQTGQEAAAPGGYRQVLPASQVSKAADCSLCIFCLE